ncbi:MAG TPA: NAD-dependent epimerase/dehydratase family protein [Candidatus Omnitrophota bacterium]|nr:NAD-dependent epimerase/dehydratase family protein [Candidatus Omnitrophota bacterium]
MPRKLKSSQLIKAECLREENKISDALQLVEGRQWTIVMIVDKDYKLRGVVSPGDLRKAILHGHSVSTPLKAIMNQSPVYIQENQFNKEYKISEIIEDIKQRYGQVQFLYAMVPVVSDESKVLGMINLESLGQYEQSSDVKLARHTVLVVGGAGYIGSVLVRNLIRLGWHVRVLDKLIYSDNSLKGLDPNYFTLIQGDATNIDDIVQAVDGVDAVVYLAELVGDPACSLAPQTTLKTNYLSVTSMAHLCSHLNINRFIYTSSCSVYGASENPDVFLTEESPLQPVSLYARIKALVEESILSVCNLPNPLFAPTILRLGTVFGHSFRPRFDLVVNTFAKNALQKGKIDVFGGNQWRPNVHVQDVCEAIIKTLDAPIEEVRAQCFNVGAGEQNHTIAELAKMTQEVFPGTMVEIQEKIVDQRNYRVDFSKIEKVLGFKSKVSVKDGLKEMKAVYESFDNFGDLDLPQYSNIASLKELNYR